MLLLFNVILEIKFKYFNYLNKDVLAYIES